MFASTNDKLLLLLLARCYQLAPNKWVKAAALIEILEQFPALAALLDAKRGGLMRELRGLAQSVQLHEQDDSYQISGAGSWTASHYRIPTIIEPEMHQVAERLVHAAS